MGGNYSKSAQETPSGTGTNSANGTDVVAKPAPAQMMMMSREEWYQMPIVWFLIILCFILIAGGLYYKFSR